jgi:hypothetical protein
MSTTLKQPLNPKQAPSRKSSQDIELKPLNTNTPNETIPSKRFSTSRKPSQDIELKPLNTNTPNETIPSKRFSTFDLPPQESPLEHSTYILHFYNLLFEYENFSQSSFLYFLLVGICMLSIIPLIFFITSYTLPLFQTIYILLWATFLLNFYILYTSKTQIYLQSNTS